MEDSIQKPAPNTLELTCNPPADPPTLPAPLTPQPHTPSLQQVPVSTSEYLLKVTAPESSRNDQQRSLAESRHSSVGKLDTAELKCSTTYGKQKRLSALACCRMERRLAEITKSDNAEKRRVVQALQKE
ncbi:unnamed protein product [Rangifer tarandus platyrhynchus]|uniref:Uncharacterized protein n=1 Tax=Rangifer tarandus platyrhynchus TaxID=3082113 RepID=A0AC59Z9G8_RANTA